MHRCQVLLNLAGTSTGMTASTQHKAVPMEHNTHRCQVLLNVALVDQGLNLGLCLWIKRVCFQQLLLQPKCLLVCKLLLARSPQLFLQCSRQAGTVKW